MRNYKTPDINKDYDIIIIGGGPAGLSAAISAYENGTESILIIERDVMLGGILNQCIHNGFGLHRFGEELTGPEYAARDIQKVQEYNIDILLDTMVINLENDKTVHFISKETGYKKIKAKAVIITTGCRERTRGAINIAGSRPSGIMTAGTAQRFINMEGYMVGKEVVILGSGDIGLIMARRMTLEGAKVKCVLELMPYSNGLTRNIVQCLDDYDIPLNLSHTIISTHGEDRLSGVTIAKVDEKLNPIEGTYEYISCDTLLLSVGLIPENELSTGAGLELDNRTKAPCVTENRESDIDGIFVAGNVLQVHDLVDFVSEEGFIAGKGASEYVRKNNVKYKESGNMLKTSPSSPISYVVPQKVNTDNLEEDVVMYMRVNKVVKNAYVIAKIQGKEIAKKKEIKFLPGEMINLKIKKELLQGKNGEISFEIKEK